MSACVEVNREGSNGRSVTRQVSAVSVPENTLFCRVAVPVKEWLSRHPHLQPSELLEGRGRGG